MAQRAVVDFNSQDGLTPQQTQKLNYNFHLLAGGAVEQGAQLSSASDNAIGASMAAESARASANEASEYSMQAFSYLLETEESWEAVLDYKEQASDTLIDIKEDAAEANDAAIAAQADATKANKYSNAALGQLGIVQDVVGVLEYAASHGSFVQTEDEEIVTGKVYFTHDVQANDYTPVIDPQAEDLGDYYELVYNDDTMGDFIMSHLAVTSRGLWVLPSGLTGGSTPDTGEDQDDSDARQSPNYKVLLSNDGMYLYDGSGVLISKFGQSIIFNDSVPQYIGGEEAYIMYYDSDDDDIPDSIIIGGSNIQLGSSKTLAEWEEEMQQAIDDASDALETAQDGAHLVITSTAGNLFKNGTESTVLQVAVFPNGGGRIDTISGVRERFGAGAYIQWRWRHDAEGTWGTLASNDSHLSQGGMWLTVTPTDVASKTSFEASLIVP